MTTLPDRPNTALLVVDVQNRAVDGAVRRDEVVANIAALVDRARSERVPVVWVQDSLGGRTGTEEWQIVPELSVDEHEPLVHKDYGDAFEQTELESILSGLQVGRLVVAGAQTDMCIRSTLHGALSAKFVK